MKKGFTLAEVLITITVIGVISSMTIPGLINRTNQKSLIEHLKKTAATLNQALYNSMVTCGQVDTWNWHEESGVETIMNNHIFPRLNIGYKCPSGTGDTSCYYPIKTIQGSIADLSGFNSTPRVLLNDGTLIAYGQLSAGTFGSNPASCVWGANPKSICAAFMVDMNGAKKPNMIGKDVFFYGIHLNGSILPFGADQGDTTIDDGCKADQDGYTCAAKLAKDGWEVCTDSTKCSLYPVRF